VVPLPTVLMALDLISITSPAPKVFAGIKDWDTMVLVVVPDTTAESVVSLNIGITTPVNADPLPRYDPLNDPENVDVFEPKFMAADGEIAKEDVTCKWSKLAESV